MQMGHISVRGTAPIRSVTPASVTPLESVSQGRADLASRQPADVRRMRNIPPEAATPVAIAGLATEHGFSTFILASDDPDSPWRFYRVNPTDPYALDPVVLADGRLTDSRVPVDLTHTHTASRGPTSLEPR